MSALNMLLPKLLITFCNLIILLDAARCPKGHSILRRGGCAPCPSGYFQPEENESHSCRPCTKCDNSRGSSVKHECTSETNTKCQCGEGFRPLETDSSTCKCNIGFELQHQECVKCKDGYFSSVSNSACQKWKECQSGVKTNGTTTSDVICNDLSDSGVPKTVTTESSSLHLHEEIQTQGTHASTIATTTTSPQPKNPTKGKGDLTPHLNRDNFIGMALLIFGIAGLLILTSVTYKLYISPCMQRKTAVQTKDSCRRPVEESGDGSLSSLKLNVEEP